MLSLLTLERKQTNSSKSFRIRIFLFLSYSFGMEAINFSYIPVVPSKTIPDSRLKWAKCIAVFRPKRRKNPTRWGGTYLYGLYKGVPPGIEEIHVIVIAFVYLEYKQNSSTNQINNAGNRDFKIRRRDGDENVAEKVNLRSFSLYRNYSYTLTLSNVGEHSWSWIPRHHIQAQ